MIMQGIFQDVLKMVENTIKEQNKNEELAKYQSKQYLENIITNINNMIPRSVYYIIRNLNPNDQIQFIKNNSQYIKKNVNNIFLCNDTFDSTNYFLSLSTLKEIYIIDKEIFIQIVDKNFKSITNKFLQIDYINFYKDYFGALNQMNNMNFINHLYCHNNFCYNTSPTLENLQLTIKKQDEYNTEFIDFLLEHYNKKISTFTSDELIKFITFIDDIETYKNFILKNKDKLKCGFENMQDYDLLQYLNSTNSSKQDILTTLFLDNIVNNRDISKVIYGIKPDIVLKLYNKDKDIFSNMKLTNWIGFCLTKNIFNEDYIKIIDAYEIDDHNEIFNPETYKDEYSICNNFDVLKYIEKKYRDNLKITGTVDEIDISTSIFSNKYLKNLKELKKLLTNNIITKSDQRYQTYFVNYIIYLKNKYVISDMSDESFKQIENLFYKIVMGECITNLLEIKNIQEITIFNRLRCIDFNVSPFTVKQIENYNVKLHSRLCQKYNNSNAYKLYKQLILKLMLLVGYHRAEQILNINDNLEVLQHLVGSVNVKNIDFDEQKNPILNKK